jgi:hypothetical protein
VRHRAFLLTLISAAAFADVDGGLAPPLQLRVRAVPSTVKVGEPFTVEVLITHLSPQRYELKTPSDLGDFDYLGQERQRQDGAASSTTTINVHLAAFALGTQKTPTLKLELTDGDAVTEVELPGAELEVVSSLPADAKTKGENLYDTRAPEELPVRTWRVLYGLAALAGLGLLAWLIARRLSRPKAQREALRPPPEPVEVRATKALDALAAQNLPGQGDFKAFYFRLSEIVRGYLGELYGFEALESTTPELLDLVRTRQTPGLAVKELAEFATESDFIRYARTEPTVDVCKQHLELAYRVVHETTAAVKALARAKALAAPRAPPPPEAR